MQSREDLEKRKKQDKSEGAHKKGAHKRGRDRAGGAIPPSPAA